MVALLMGILVVVILLILEALVSSWVFQFVWNKVVASILNLQPITQWQGLLGVIAITAVAYAIQLTLANRDGGAR